MACPCAQRAETGHVSIVDHLVSRSTATGFPAGPVTLVLVKAKAVERRGAVAIQHPGGRRCSMYGCNAGARGCDEPAADPAIEP